MFLPDLVDRVHEDLRSTLYANPHSNSGPAQAVANDIQLVRTQILEFFGANREDWDVVFVANATAAIKLTADCFRDYAEEGGKEFWYGYHRDSHTLFLPRKRQDFGVYFVRALIVDCGVMMRTLRQGRISDGGTAALRLNAIGCNLQGGLKEVDLSYSHDLCISREPIYHTAGPLAVSQISTNGVMHLR